ncbi:MAG TPA: PqqD family protein [Thermoanaerobaculia bacterium]|jgi:hypothetical protein
MHVAKEIAWQVVDGEAIIVDLASGKTIGLNPTGTYLWTQLDGRDEHELAAALAAKFDVDQESASRDVREFLSLLRERRLLTES